MSEDKKIVLLNEYLWSWEEIMSDKMHIGLKRKYTKFEKLYAVNVKSLIFFFS